MQLKGDLYDNEDNHNYYEQNTYLGRNDKKGLVLYDKNASKLAFT